jgi:ariadne-1
MEEMQITSDLTWIEVQFMKKAVDEVEKCRMTLQWTYAMAYYLDRGNEKELFEDNQRFVCFVCSQGLDLTRFIV